MPHDLVAIALVVIPLLTLVAVLGGLIRTAMRPRNETDDLCARVDADLDATYGNGHGAR